MHIDKYFHILIWSFFQFWPKFHQIQCWFIFENWRRDEWKIEFKGALEKLQILCWQLLQKSSFFAEVSYLDGGNQVVYANNFFSGQHSQCQDQSSHTEVASNGDDPNYTGANLFGGLWSGTCGTSNLFANSQTDRIVGGEETEEHQYPWMVTLIFFHPITVQSQPKSEPKQLKTERKQLRRA